MGMQVGRMTDDNKALLSQIQKLLTEVDKLPDDIDYEQLNFNTLMSSLGNTVVRGALNQSPLFAIANTTDAIALEDTGIQFPEVKVQTDDHDYNSIQEAFDECLAFMKEKESQQTVLSNVYYLRQEAMTEQVWKVVYTPQTWNVPQLGKRKLNNVVISEDAVDTMITVHESLRTTEAPTVLALWSLCEDRKPLITQEISSVVTRVAASQLHPQLYALGYEDGGVGLLDVREQQKLVESFIQEESTAPTIDLKFSHDSELLYSAHTDNTIKVWSLKNMTQPMEMVTLSESYGSNLASATFFGNDQLMLSSVEGIISIANMQGSKLLPACSADCSERVVEACFNDNHVWSLTHEWILRKRTISSLSEKCSLRLTKPVTTFHCMDKTEVIIIGSAEGEVCAGNIVNGQFKQAVKKKFDGSISKICSRNNLLYVAGSSLNVMQTNFNFVDEN